ncbi:uncharacterized protein (DUF305 family) [Kribbella rubisoli]|uniref:Uncharacterized protein (DUF305 family) n=1 Tax=Kribbella rubisoli TaxID=3075929 RepID=A0A4Q7X6Y4_9ACTN|nr:DUF305 domain-containing protein [Kribbella rubisoli]RZU18453.1 uncharacterized protein (DUF305 family) [Kribbella rubisoli]
MTHVYRTTAASAALLAAVFGVTGCGSDSSPSTPPATSAAASFNDADATFAMQMIPHHQQAVEMSDLALRKATTAAVKNLATAIKAAQDPEIKQLSGWLTAWGKPVPTPGEHSGHAMAGMMSTEDMSDLSEASGAMFDRMWTRMMIEHHQGAVAMATTEQTAGKDPAAIALAKKIQTTQTTEIATMKRLLGQLTAS